MASAKKVKKKKPSKAWANFKLGFSSLFNNDTVINLRGSKWWIPTILGFVSSLIAIIPTLTNYYKLQGEDLLDSPVGGLTNGLVSFAEKLDENDINIIIDGENKALKFSNEDQVKWNNTFPEVNGYHVYTHTYTVTTDYVETIDSLDESNSIVQVPGNVTTKTETKCDLVVFNLSDLEDDIFDDTIFGDSDGYTMSGSIAILKGTDPTPQMNNPYATSTLFIGKNKFSIIKNPSGYKLSSSGGYREFKYEGCNFNLRDLVRMNCSGKEYTISKAETTPINYNQYLTEASAAWNDLLTTTWNHTKVVNAWKQTGIWWAIYVGVILFMGLMIFVLTRGKMNPYHEFSFWGCQKIAYWASISPAILGMILGFIMPKVSQFGFLIFYGIRILWMAFKNLRPIRQ